VRTRRRSVANIKATKENILEIAVCRGRELGHLVAATVPQKLSNIVVEHQEASPEPSGRVANKNKQPLTLTEH